MFRTEFDIPEIPIKISLGQELITLGSCFSDTIGKNLADHKFNISANPFGTVFNPLSLSRLIRMSLSGQKIKEDDLLSDGEVFYHYDFHSDLSDTSSMGLVNKINDKLMNFSSGLKNADHLVLTFGTAWVYQLRDTGEVVSNCHKMPSAFFERYLLSVKKILDEYEQLLESLQEINPGLRISLTVSPVRHTRDGLDGNQVSKSVLRLVCYFLERDHDEVSYFPSYELLLDDLRDYRFYDRDLIHPSEEAVDYIWKKFIKTYMDPETTRFIDHWAKIRKALYHKPFHAHTESHHKFLQNTLSKLAELSHRVDVSKEMEVIQKQLAHE